MCGHLCSHSGLLGCVVKNRPHNGSHCASQFPELLVPLPTGRCTWASLLPMGPSRLKTPESDSYLISVLL